FLALISHYAFNRREPLVSEFSAWLAFLQLFLTSLWQTQPHLKEKSLAPLLVLCNLYYLATLVSSIAVYRLFFHPLRKYPGPVLGKLSKFYFSYIGLVRGGTHLWLEELHQRHGKIVRYGPNELSFIDPDDAMFIQGGQSFKLFRGPWYDGNPSRKGFHTLVMASTRNVENHKFRRRIWEKAFTHEALRSYEPKIMQMVDNLVGHCEKSASNLVDISRSIDHFAFDAMGYLSFGQDFGMVSGTSSGASQEWAQKLGDYMRTASLIRPIPWFKNLYNILPIDSKGKSGGRRFVDMTMSRFEDRYIRGSEAGADIFHYLLQPDPKTGMALSKFQVAEESVIIVTAGSDTTSITMTFALYYLLKTPEAYARLVEEVDLIWDGRTSLEGRMLGPSQAPYLNAVINESLRIAHPDPNGNQRSTPKGGYMINGKYIPELTQLSVHKWSMQRDESSFTKAHEFIPERWISDEERSRFEITNHNVRAWIGFGGGLYGCVGKPLALVEMRLFIVGFLRRLDIAPCPNYDLSRFPRETTSTLTLV
ncbi:hypothetical protein OIDMADRAFT_95520, partial [Oidiodendron maius Zn]